MGSILKNSKYKDYLYDGYYFENINGERMPLKWIATTGKYYIPYCFKLDGGQFRCITDPDNIKGKIQIDAHIYSEGILLLQAKMDFDEYLTINQLIEASIPTNILITDRENMRSILDKYATEIIEFLETKIDNKKKVIREKASPWHHNWIWWDFKPKIPISEFDMGKKYFYYALGMCTRSDKWRFLNIQNYSAHIEDVVNLSPYKNNCVYLTHPGNCIIPSDEFIDVNSVKNTLIDVIFAAEIGNVQRYLILNYLQDLNFRSLEIQEILQNYHKAALSTKELIYKLEDIEQEINEIILEINKNLQVSRTPRLLFTSVFKTKIMQQMIHVLHGDIFMKNLAEIIHDLKDSLTRQRDITSMRVDAEENTFLRNLQIVFIIGLIAQMITLFYMDVSTGFNWEAGTIFTFISICLSLIVLYILKKLK